MKKKCKRNLQSERSFSYFFDLIPLPNTNDGIVSDVHYLIYFSGGLLDWR